MFGFEKKVFVAAIAFFSCNVLNVHSLKCVSMNNQERKIRPEPININSDNPLFYPQSIEISKCSGSCNNMKDPYAKLCVPDVFKNVNVKVFNVVSVTNETRHKEWHEICKCKCRIDLSVCNNKQRWNKDKCRCEYEEFIDKEIYDKGYFRNPSNCECECDKPCDVGEYLVN